MTIDNADSADRPRRQVSVDEQFRDIPVQRAADLSCDGVFDTDDEVDELMAHIHASRRADLA